MPPLFRLITKVKKNSKNRARFYPTISINGFFIIKMQQDFYSSEYCCFQNRVQKTFIQFLSSGIG